MKNLIKRILGRSKVIMGTRAYYVGAYKNGDLIYELSKGTRVTVSKEGKILMVFMPYSE